MSFFLPQPLQAADSDRKRFPAPGQVHSALVNSYGTWYNKFYCIAPEKPRCASQCARRHPGAQPETALFSSGPCLKNVNIPKRRVFFRHTALIFLAIHQGLPRQIALPSEKSLAAGRSAPWFLPFGETPVRRGKAGRCGGDGGERAAQCPDVAFRPRMPTRSRAAKKIRAGAAGSLNRTMPAIRAPRAPIPVQIA